MADSEGSAFAAAPLRRDSLRMDLAPLASASACRAEARYGIHASEGWLGGRDSNPDNVVQSHVSYR